jgi:hypothetical protein
VKAADLVILYRKADLDRLAAYFAVFDVGLAVYRQIQDHRNLLTAIRTIELVFH